MIKNETYYLAYEIISKAKTKEDIKEAIKISKSVLEK